MIQVRGLTKTIVTPTHTVEILRGIDLEIPRGQFAAIMGPSGSGKSTLLGLLAGLDTPTSGDILLDGEDITGLEEDDLALLRGRKIGFVFQSYQLIPTLTAEENVLLPLELSGDSGDGAARARELLDSVGLIDRRDHYPVQLSGGEQQRVALARAFMVRPSHPAGRRAHRQSGQRQRPARSGTAAVIEPARRHDAGAGDARSAAFRTRRPAHHAARWQGGER